MADWITRYSGFLYITYLPSFFCLSVTYLVDNCVFAYAFADSSGPICGVDWILLELNRVSPEFELYKILKLVICSVV